jgi:hypothetical protein
MPVRPFRQGCLRFARCSFALSLFLLLAAALPAAFAQSQSDTPPIASAAMASGQQGSPSASIATISGTVVDQEGAVAVGAQVNLAHPGGAVLQTTISGDNGQFAFLDVPPGPYQLTVTAGGFDPKTVVGSIHAGEAQIAPEIVLAVAATTTSVKVTADTEEIAQQQIEYQEKQRVLGFIPNFYASYVPDAAPLVPRQKFQLAWKSVTDPISIVGVGFLAGIYQASDELSGYGQGAAGYGRRFGATYGDVFIGTFIGSAILPSVLHQDPRYFYRGPDASGSRFLYAIGNAVICKGDNKKYQFNYSAVLGSFITSGISQAYYPASDRGTSLYFQTALIRIAEGSVAGLFQEYVVKKLTPHLKKDPPPQP